MASSPADSASPPAGRSGTRQSRRAAVTALASPGRRAPRRLQWPVAKRRVALRRRPDEWIYRRRRCRPPFQPRCRLRGLRPRYLRPRRRRRRGARGPKVQAGWSLRHPTLVHRQQYWRATVLAWSRHAWRAVTGGGNAAELAHAWRRRRRGRCTLGAKDSVTSRIALAGQEAGGRRTGCSLANNRDGTGAGKD